MVPTPMQSGAGHKHRRLPVSHGAVSASLLPFHLVASAWQVDRRTTGMDDARARCPAGRGRLQSLYEAGASLPAARTPAARPEQVRPRPTLGRLHSAESGCVSPCFPRKARGISLHRSRSRGATRTGPRAIGQLLRPTRGKTISRNPRGWLRVSLGPPIASSRFPSSAPSRRSGHPPKRARTTGRRRRSRPRRWCRRASGRPRRGRAGGRCR